MRLWIQISATMSGATVNAPPRPSRPPSSRASRTCFRYAIRASFFGLCPGPAIRTHSSASGPKWSAAASAMYSGARAGSARIRFQSDWGGLSNPSSSDSVIISVQFRDSPSEVEDSYGFTDNRDTPSRHSQRRDAGGARAADRAADQGLLDGDRDGDQLHRQLDQPRRRARPR